MVFLLFVQIGQAQILFGNSLKKGFEALHEYNFFKAKEIFTKKLKRHPVAANYGLALIRYDKLNHFHSLDTAFIRILDADSAWNLLASSARVDLWEFGISDTSISGFKDRIYLTAFREANTKNTPEAFSHYWHFFTDSPFQVEAKLLEVQRAFAIADSVNSSAAIAKFIGHYPEAEQIKAAIILLDDAIFRESTKNQTEEEFDYFIASYPESIHRNEAEDALFSILVKDQTTKELYAFVKKYPENRNADQAWEMIYVDYTSDQRVESFEAFKKAYPEYPYPERLKRDVRLASSSLYPAANGDLWGYVDSTGKVILTYQFDEAWPFSENLAMVRMDEKIGYINKAGIKVVKPLFDDGESFIYQLAIVEQDGFYGIIDARGNIVLPVEYDMVSGPDDGFYQISKNDLYGFADKLGKIRIEPQYENTDDFSEGMAAVTQNGLVGFIDTTGALIIPFRFDVVLPFEFGSARVMLNDKVGLIDKTGNELIAINNERIGSFQEGLCKVTRAGKCAFYDRNGKQIIDFKPYCSSPVLGVDGFSEGLARIEKSGRKGYMNRQGKIVIPIEFEESGYFSSGLATFRKRRKWGYINTKGKVIVDAKYDDASTFSGNLGKVRKGDYYGLINQKGELVLPIAWDEILEDGDFYILQKDGKMKLIDKELESHTELIWDDIRRTDDKEVFRLSIGIKLALFHTLTKQVFWEENKLERPD